MSVDDDLSTKPPSWKYLYYVANRSGDFIYVWTYVMMSQQRFRRIGTRKLQRNALKFFAQEMRQQGILLKPINL